MAVEVSVPRPASVRLPLGLERIAALPAQLVLAGIVAASFVLRFAAALGHATPLYFADEYIYSSLARSLAHTGKPLIRHGPAHFPALLEPLLAAPFWISNDPGLAYRLTQAENALAMSLAAVPVYLLARKLGLSKWLSLAGAALTVASADLFFSSFVLSDPIAYPLVLGAVCAAVYALAAPTWRNQLTFVVLTGLTTFDRIQYVLLPGVFLGAALVVERGRLRTVLRRYRLALGLFAAPVVAIIAIGPTRLLGYYSLIVHLNVRPVAMAHWIGTDSMLLVYCAGWVLVPGALVGLGYALVRPQSREESAFAAVFVFLAVALFAETSMYAANGAPRFQERYFMAILPLCLPAFGLYLKRDRPARLAIALSSTFLLALSARVPLAGYTIGDSKQDSPFLFGVFRLERSAGAGTGSLAVALAAAALSVLAVAVAWRVRGAVAAAIAIALVTSCGVSLASVRFDSLVSRGVRESLLPRDLRWIDHARLGKVLLLQTPGTPHVRAHEELFWNTSLDEVLFLDQASPIDAFRDPRVKIAPDGRFVRAGGATVRAPLAISNYAVRMELRGAERVASGAGYVLWRPVGTPRVTLFAGGLYHDGWLGNRGVIMLYPVEKPTLRGTLRMRLWLPAGTERTPLRLTAPGVDRTITVAPGQTRVLTLPVASRGPWTLHFRTNSTGTVGFELRPISVKAATPVFTPKPSY
ncbi:MAG: phospholipid carrier-dependent glycosyltransferase [Gaiellaceae bacterium]